LRPLKVTLSPLSLRFRFRKFASQAIHFRLEGAGINLKQKVALSNDLALLKVHALQVTRNSRPNLHGVDGFKTTREFVAVAELFANDFRYGHLGRRRGRRLGGTRAANTERRQGRQPDRCGQPKHPVFVVSSMDRPVCFRWHDAPQGSDGPARIGYLRPDQGIYTLRRD
jgi:hypothetical protein